jgi:polyisoprenoid-binding protein YceI
MNGQIEFAENLQNSSCTIELSLDNFSTFDSYRDESLMTDLYFNQAKYPGMTYVAKKMIIDKDGSLIFDGQFTMLGVSKSIKVAMNRIKTESGIQLLATGKIDRTEFGMNPSASEGNIVSFKAFCELIP